MYEMKIIWLSVVMFLAGCKTTTDVSHDHVHHELPEWETLNEAVIRTSGDPSTGVSTYYWGDGH